MISETYVFWHRESIALNHMVLIVLVFNWVLGLEFLVCIVLMNLVRVLVPGAYIDNALKFNYIVYVIRDQTEAKRNHGGFAWLEFWFPTKPHIFLQANACSGQRQGREFH